MTTPFEDAVAGLQAAKEAGRLAEGDPEQALLAIQAFEKARTLVGAALAESTNTPAVENALKAKLNEVNDRLAVLREQAGRERPGATVQHRGDNHKVSAVTEPQPVTLAASVAPASTPQPELAGPSSPVAGAAKGSVARAPEPTTLAPTPSAPPAPPALTPQPDVVRTSDIAGPSIDYVKESFELLKLAMAADAKAKQGDGAQALEAAVQYTRTLEMLDAGLAPGNCPANIQEKLRTKREDVASKRSELVEVVGTEQLEAALQEANLAAANTPEEAVDIATTQSHATRAPHSPVRTPAFASAPAPEPEPEPQFVQHPTANVSAIAATPATLLGSPFAWRAPTGTSEHGGAATTPASAMYGDLSPIPGVTNRRQTSADALAQMERTLAESSRAFASVKEYSAKTLAEVGGRSRKPSTSGPLPSSPSVSSTPIAASSGGFADVQSGWGQASDHDVDISVRLQALQMERARRERAEAQLRDEAERRAEAERAAKNAAEDLERLKAALVAAEKNVAARNVELEHRESQLAEQARQLEKTQAESSQAMQAAEERARELTRDRLERASEKARAYADEAMQRANAKVESERKLKEEAQHRAQEEADRRAAAEGQAAEAADALSKMEQVYAAAEKKAQQTAEVLARKEAEIAEANEALHRTKEAAERLVFDAQARAREEAESRGKAAAEAAMQVAEEAAQRASEKVSTEIALRDEALATSRAEVAKREAAERRNDELSDNLLRLEVMHEEAQEALLRSQSEADTAAELVDSLRRQAEQERLSHDEETHGVAEARRAAELRAEETTMALAKAQQMLNAQAEALARVRADADRLVSDATAKVGEKVASVVNQKKSAAREADARLRREVAARTRLERQHSETVEALAKTEAMLAASTEALEQARKEAHVLRFQETPINAHGTHSSGGFGIGLGYDMPIPAAAAEVPEGDPVGSSFVRREDDGGQPKALQRLAERRARRNKGALSVSADTQQRQVHRSRGAARTELRHTHTGLTKLQPQPQHEQSFREHLRSRGLEQYFAKLSGFVNLATSGWRHELDELTKEDAMDIGLSSEELKSLRARRPLEL